MAASTLILAFTTYTHYQWRVQSTYSLLVPIVGGSSSVAVYQKSINSFCPHAHN